jgi:hypothetical protein
MRTPIKLVAAMLAAACTMATTTAQAQQLERTDGTGDVVLRDPDSNQVTVEPDWANGDIVGLRVNHGPHRVKARLTFDELTRNVGAIFHDFEIRTPRRHFSAQVLTNEDAWKGDSELWLPGRPKDCDGLKHKVDYAQDVVRVWVPRKCLGSPRWVRVGAGTSTWREDDESEGIESRWDEALRTGEDGKESRHMTLTERKLRSA